MSEFSVKFAPVQKTVDGAPVSIRECMPSDAGALNECIRQYLSDSVHIPLTLQEFSASEHSREDWIRSLHERSNSLLLVASFNGVIIGNIDITGGRRERLKHTGLIGMGILKEWRGKGLGSLLLHSAVEWARKQQDIELLWLQVYAANIPGIGLYRKYGFEQTGVQHRFIKLADGNYTDNMLMQLQIR